MFKDAAKLSNYNDKTKSNLLTSKAFDRYTPTF